ncbi:MAG: hypothetical protein ACYDCW_16265 [Acidithiobacillus ferrivorans]
MLSDENVYHNPFNAPYGVYPANEESLRHAAAWIRISMTHIARRFYARWRAPRTVTISASPSYPMDAVLSRFADNLHNLNQRRENDANRQRQARARKKAGDRSRDKAQAHVGRR